MIINDRNIKMWSTIGSRATFGIAALELAKEVENLMVSPVMFQPQQDLIDTEKLFLKNI